MTAEDESRHPSQRPLVGWIGVVLAGTLAALALVHSAQARALVIVLGLTVGVFGWISFHYSRNRRVALTAGAATFVALAALLALLVLTGGAGEAGHQGDDLPDAGGPTSPLPSMPTSSRSSTASPTMTRTAERTPSPSPTGLPSQVRGKDAPNKVVKEGHSVTVFGGDLLIGVPMVFDSFVSLNAQSDFGSCDASPSVGETLIVTGSMTDSEGTSAEAHVWYRIALLQIVGRAATIRVERIIATERPESTSYSC